MNTETPIADAAIRPARATDYSAIERLLTASGLPLDGIREALCSLLVAESRAEIVGVVGLEQCGSYGLLRSTAVAPEWRGKGLGRRLVEQMVAQAEAKGLHALYLLTTTAERYFPSFGFNVTTRDVVPPEVQATSEFQGACPASATVMCLPVSR